MFCHDVCLRFKLQDDLSCVMYLDFIRDILRIYGCLHHLMFFSVNLIFVRFPLHTQSNRSQCHLASTPESKMLQGTLPCNKSYTSLSNEADIPDMPTMGRNLSRPSSLSSLSGMDMSDHGTGKDLSGPIGTLMSVLTGDGRNVQTGALLNLIVLTLLLFATVMDVASRTSNSSSTSTTYAYNEDLSGEVLYPPKSDIYGSSVTSGSTVTSANKGNHSPIKEKGLLGSAMIHSVTEILSPILPFAGGVDLRRDDNWKSWSSWLALWGGDSGSFAENTNSKEYYENPSTIAENVVNLPRGGGRNKQQLNNASRNSSVNFKMSLVLSASEPFLSIKDISEMTLQEIAFTIQYVLESGSENFDIVQFLSGEFNGRPINSRMIAAVKAIDKATAQSRGDGVLPARTRFGSYDAKEELLGNTDSSSGDIDVLKFCAAMRIFAEWRVLRQVPPGYKGYAVGMSLGHKDVVQNVGKIENAVHQWIESTSIEVATIKADHDRKECLNVKSKDSSSMDIVRCESSPETILPRSPTMRQLLQHEIDMDIHPNSKLPRLKEKTAAMGLLWVRRQLHYQTTLFNNIINVPEVFPTIIDAVTAGYSEVYGNLHGWTVQKIFNYSFQSAPDADLIFRHMNPIQLEKVISAARNGEVEQEAQLNEAVSTANSKEDDKLHIINLIEDTNQEEDNTTLLGKGPIVDSARLSVMEDKSEGNNPFLNVAFHFGNEWDKLGHHIGGEVDKLVHHVGGEWDKLICNTEKLFNKGSDNKSCKVNDETINTRGGASKDIQSQGKRVIMSEEELENHISREMAADARTHIKSYLGVAIPLLDDIAAVFDEMNMDDPTKV